MTDKPDEFQDVMVVFTGAVELASGKLGAAFIMLSTYEQAIEKPDIAAEVVRRCRSPFDVRPDGFVPGGVYLAQALIEGESLSSMRTKTMVFQRRLRGDIVLVWELETRGLKGKDIQRRAAERARKNPAVMDEIENIARLLAKVPRSQMEWAERAVMALIRDRAIDLAFPSSRSKGAR